MKKTCCIICGKYKKFRNSKAFKKTLVLSIICNKCGTEDEKMLKEEESIEKLKSLVFFC